MANVGELVASISLGGMDAVERQLKTFSRKMDSVARDASKMGKKLREAGEGFNELGENIAPLSAGFVAMGGASVVASDNINSAINNFQTKLGATGADLAKYEGVMQEVASTGVGSFDEVSDAVIDVAKNMKGLSDQDLATVSNEAMHLAEVMGSDVGEVSKVAGQLMTQFGVDGQEALDLIAKGYQNGMDYAGDYMDSLNEYSVYFDSLGFSAEDMFNVLAEGAENGAFNLDKVGDAVKEFNIRAKDGSDSTAEAFESLGFNAEKMSQTFAKGGEGAKGAYAQVVQELAKVEDQTERNELGVALFGTQYEDMEKDVIASTGAIVDHMGDVDGTAQQLADNNMTFAKEMQGYWNEIQVAIEPVGEVMRSFISDVMPPLVAGIKNAANAFTGLSPAMQKVVLAFGAFIAFLPVLLIGFGSVISVVSSFITTFSGMSKTFSLVSSGGAKLIGAFKRIGSAFMWLGRLFLTNPFMLIVTGIVVVAVLIYKYWDEIVAFTKSIWSGLSAWFAPYWESFKQMIASVVVSALEKWQSFKSGFMSIFNSVLSFLQGVWSVIKTIFIVGIAVIVTLVTSIYGVFVNIFTKISNFVSKIIEFMKKAFSAWVNAIKAYLDLVKSVWSKVWNFIYSNIISPIVSKIKDMIGRIVTHVQLIMSKIKSFFKAGWDFVYNNIVKPIIDRIKKIVSTIADNVREITGKVKSFFSSAFDKVVSKVTDSVNKVKDKISGIWDKAKEIAGKIKSGFSDIFTGIKIPKFSISNASLNPKDWVTKGMPKLNVDWNASGGILDSATFIGAGEKGTESIVPLSSQRKMKPFAQAVSRFMPEKADGSSGKTEINIAQMVVREDADIEKIAKELNKLQERKGRAIGGLSFNG